HAHVIGCDTNSGGGSYALIEFNPPPGAQYLAFADGLDGAQGIIHFNWFLGRPPMIDPAASNCTQVVITNTTVTISSGVTNASPTPTYTWYYYDNLLTGQTNSTISFSSVN